MSSLRKSIEYILLRDGEATARQLSDKLGTNTTDVYTELRVMYDAGIVLREKIWSGKYAGSTYRYRHKETPEALPGVEKETSRQRARYVTCKGKRVARLTAVMYDQVQRYGQSGDREMRIKGPAVATTDQRTVARSRGYALPETQFIRLDIVKLMDSSEDITVAYYALEATNQRTVNALLEWHPEFKLGD